MLVLLGFSPVATRNRITSALKRELIQDDIAIWVSLRKCLAQLPHDPLGVGMPGHVDVQNPAAAVLDHEQTIEYAEGQRGRGEQVDCGDHLVMIAEECEPSPARISTWPEPSPQATIRSDRIKPSF
jgi:hypothetical protein